MRIKLNKKLLVRKEDGSVNRITINQKDYYKFILPKGCDFGNTLDENGNEDDSLNKQIEELFKEWEKPKNCDITGQQSFKELCTMAVRRIRVDGAIIFIKNYTEDGIVPFKLQSKERKLNPNVLSCSL